MKLQSPTQTLILDDDAKPSIDDQNDIISSLTEGEEEFMALCTASTSTPFPCDTVAQFHAKCAEWMEANKDRFTTVIDDGTLRFPVRTADLTKWERDNGFVTPENYEHFCDDVDHLMPDALPGSPEMVAECERLVAAGAKVYRP